MSFQSASNIIKLKLKLKSLISEKAVNFNSHLKTFYVGFRFQFYIKIKRIETKIIFQHEVFVITPTLNAGSRCSRHVSHGNTIIVFFNFFVQTCKQ